MQIVGAKKDEFIKLVKARDETGCIKYIDKYDDFYDTIVINGSEQSILQYVCAYKLVNVALALIDKKCNLTHQDIYKCTALIYASCYGLRSVVAYIIDKSTDITTRKISSGMSEIMYLANNRDEENVIKMIDRGYDIYYKTDTNISLFTTAIFWSEEIIKKLIDKDNDFIGQFKEYYENSSQITVSSHTKNKFNHNIAKYCQDKYDVYKHEIIATMNDASPDNILYQSFHTTYAVQLVDIICDFLISPIKKS
ncbi:MAG: hypothetical protein Faunusvirus13_11 [Faunusvirus sp.]|jgi:hypothetical protein|uniref:Uncharacterized protein n=1 Tax=Faunusvirus sp. TaxID=2487766 RepID=A0A3G4ZWY0_9VIRU|nr:MAG: hypothetical protein Faunusvirus13_11 [Faunusvirus sp.]